MPRLGLVPALVLLLASAPMRAEWQLLSPERSPTDPPDSERAAATIAEVTGSDGMRLGLRRTGDGGLRLRLEPGPGLLALREEVCPSYRIDQQPAFSQTDGAPGCAAVDGGSELTLDAPTLAALRRGSALSITVALRGAGYRQLAFSLQGSGRAIAAALGEPSARAP